MTVGAKNGLKMDWLRREIMEKGSGDIEKEYRVEERRGESIVRKG